MNFRKLVVTTASVFALAACNQEVPQDVVDQNMTITRLNAQKNGDGWASGAIQFKSGAARKIKCQTNGTGKGINGCMAEVEFATKTYKDDGRTLSEPRNSRKV